jgi:DNA-binding response OmpR family regulator
MTNVLYVEDEESLAMIVSDSLEAQGFIVRHVLNGQQALIFHNKYKPDIIVMDVMMPIMDGFTTAKEIRKTDLVTPIIFLTAMTQTEDVVKGFKLGANDYIRKPFKIEELIVRMEAALKKNGNSMSPSKLVLGNYTLDCAKNTFSLGESSEKLSYRESELLKRLIENKDKVVPRDEIIRTYWSNDTYFTGRSLDVFISRIRKYLSEDERIKITNIRGVGYMLTVD